MRLGMSVSPLLLRRCVCVCVQQTRWYSISFVGVISRENGSAPRLHCETPFKITWLFVVMCVCCDQHQKKCTPCTFYWFMLDCWFSSESPKSNANHRNPSLFFFSFVCYSFTFYLYWKNQYRNAKNEIIHICLAILCAHAICDVQKTRKLQQLQINKIVVRDGTSVFFVHKNP